MKILFVCSRNLRRSLTAEHIFKNHPDLEVKSAGISPSARVRVSEKLLRWADVVMVMEKRHRTILYERFGDVGEEIRIEILDIVDEYAYMDAELVELLEVSVEEWLSP
jgi:predicted protein tyrosine phosphatase